MQFTTKTSIVPHIHTIKTGCINEICFVKLKDYDTTVSVSFLLPLLRLLTVAITVSEIELSVGFVNFTTAIQKPEKKARVAM